VQHDLFFKKYARVCFVSSRHASAFVFLFRSSVRQSPSRPSQ
jgi:hypothetical protein